MSIKGGSTPARRDCPEQIPQKTGYVQYLDWAGKALRRDLGTSLFTRGPVINLIMARIGVTITLAFSALAVSLIAEAAIAAVRHIVMGANYEHMLK